MGWPVTCRRDAGAPLGALQLAGAAKGAHVDPLGRAPLLPLERRAAAVQAVVVRLPIRQQAAGDSRARGQETIHHGCQNFIQLPCRLLLSVSPFGSRLRAKAGQGLRTFFVMAAKGIRPGASASAGKLAGAAQERASWTGHWTTHANPLETVTPTMKPTSRKQLHADHERVHDMKHLTTVPPRARFATPEP